ncbi:hypothetical protein ACFFRR_004717 [Megaselia abdita]
MFSRFFILFIVLRCSFALDNGLALTPPMGFMSWQRYRCITDCEKRPTECISEQLFKNIADAIVEEGYKDAGYEYVIIDDCWLEFDRDNVTNKLVADRDRFPSGMKALADYIHGKGLKFGLYEDYGTHTCAGYPGVINNMKLDAETFAEWEVDYVKLDGCYADSESMDKGYPEFGDHLNQTGRQMVYSCSWPVYQEIEGVIPNYELMIQYCNLWRNWGDIDDSYNSLREIMDYFAINQERIQPHAGPGHWNDPDMLILGNYGLSYEQSKTQMAVWAILAAPLLMSTDLRSVTPEIRAILQNKNVIGINQDALGIQGKRVKVVKDIEVWIRPVLPLTEHYYSYAVAFVSRRTDGIPFDLSLKLSEFKLDYPIGYQVRDLFELEELGPLNYTIDDFFDVRVNPSGVQFYKFTIL